MKTIALLITLLNVVALFYLIHQAHIAQLESQSRYHEIELNALQADLDHERAVAAQLYQILSQQEQGIQLEKLGAQ